MNEINVLKFVIFKNNTEIIFFVFLCINTYKIKQQLSNFEPSNHLKLAFPRAYKKECIVLIH